MAHSDATRPTSRPIGHLISHSIQPVSLPLESEPPSREIAGEDFLYHLSRGSELLKENLVAEAKEALEVALSLQPMDLRGQGLLGVVYFRLGLYPRAIDIYRQIVDAFPDEITPKVNLALCYVKTGQQPAARELLEIVVQRDPEHHRAWAYLGLVFQFLRDYTKAEAAFERAGQQGMAERMRHLVQAAAAPNDGLHATEVGPERWELRAAAQDAFGEIESNTVPFRIDPSANHEQPSTPGRWRATEPGEESIPRRPSTPPPSQRPPSFRPPRLPNLSAAETPETASSAPTRLMGSPAGNSTGSDCATDVNQPQRLRDWLASRSLEVHARCISLLDPRTILVDLDEPFAIRANAVMGVSPCDIAKREIRVLCRTRATDNAEPLGGAQSPIVGLLGPGRLLARADQGVVELFELEDESVTVRLTQLFGLSLGLRYESERLKLGHDQTADFVRVSGTGTIALVLVSRAKTFDLMGDGLVVRFDDLVGWTARVLPEAVDPAEAPGRMRGYVALRGDGAVILA